MHIRPELSLNWFQRGLHLDRTLRIIPKGVLSGIATMVCALRGLPLMQGDNVAFGVVNHRQPAYRRLVFPKYRDAALLDCSDDRI